MYTDSCLCILFLFSNLNISCKEASDFSKCMQLTGHEVSLEKNFIFLFTSCKVSDINHFFFHLRDYFICLKNYGKWMMNEHNAFYQEKRFA